MNFLCGKQQHHHNITCVWDWFTICSPKCRDKNHMIMQMMAICSWLCDAIQFSCRQQIKLNVQCTILSWEKSLDHKVSCCFSNSSTRSRTVWWEEWFLATRHIYINVNIVKHMYVCFIHFVRWHFFIFSFSLSPFVRYLNRKQQVLRRRIVCWALKAVCNITHTFDTVSLAFGMIFQTLFKQFWHKTNFFYPKIGHTNADTRNDIVCILHRASFLIEIGKK